MPESCGERGISSMTPAGADIGAAARSRGLGGVSISLADLDTMRRAEESAGRLAAIVESSIDAIVGKTLEGVITSWNRAAERLFGYTAKEAIGRSITMLIPPERREEEREILARLERGERIEHYETVRVAKDGRRIDISLSISPVRDRSGRILGAAKIARDISGQKQAERQLEMMVNELDHRVKNTLTLVSAISAQTLRACRSPEQFQVAFEGRISALAQAHRQLSSARWRGAPLEALIRRTVEPYLSDGRPSPRLQGPSIMLTPRATLTLALVFHELATNAAKYGALSQARGGSLDIDWETSAGDQDQRLRLRWVEHAGSPIVQPKEDGFGMTLIRRSVEHELSGGARLSFSSRGLACEIDVPWSDEVGSLRSPDAEVRR